ncbi:hypothetical protein DFH08DRAFT_1089490 [Mycena albidolilacea]|uniref:intramembrane prenyl-peptidase Rce1 n=1 Tax=Mycena albidolilacea TaxID=1033008 RepID=A0AAD7E8L1_9AGAR|nr:hypothetical protein DFH08DRAFT_1089490 [Mycena albidolilacea]
MYVLVARSTVLSFNRSFATTLMLLGLRLAGQHPILHANIAVVSGAALRKLSRGESPRAVQIFSHRDYAWVGSADGGDRVSRVRAVCLRNSQRNPLIAFAPLVFGFDTSHVNHAWHTYNHYKRTKDALKRAVLLFQTASTTLFGAYTSHLFLRTSSIVPPLTVHVFCNIMGFPQLQTEMRRFPAQKLVIVGVYIIGIMLFVCMLGPWTEPCGDFGLASFNLNVIPFVLQLR